MRRLAAILAAAVVVAILGLAQLILPGVAAQRLRDQLGRHGRVLDVEVSAFPAIELLWHQADHVVIRMTSYRSTGADLSRSLGQVRDADAIDASASTVTAGLLTLHDATLTKRGDRLSGTARVSESDLRTAVPFLDSVQPIASSGGQLVLRGQASLFGVSAVVDATVTTSGGVLDVTPDVPLGGLATVQLFANPHLAVTSVSAAPAADGFSVAASGRTR